MRGKTAWLAVLVVGVCWGYGLKLATAADAGTNQDQSNRPPAQTKTCQPIDAEFRRTGQIALSKIVSGSETRRGQSVGSPEYLDGMLDALPNDGAGYRYGDTLPGSVRVTIQAGTGIVVSSKLPDGTVSASIQHRMDCMDGFWAISKGVMSGSATTAKYTLIIDQLSDGTLRVQRLLKSGASRDVPEGSFDVMAYFKRIPS